MESIFLILSGAILAAGVLYWLWSHIQLMQKKVHLLENAVFELREIQGGPGLGHRHSEGQEQEQDQSQEQSQESDEREIPVYRDVDDNDDGDWASGSASTPLASLDAMDAATPVDLQPGGRIEVPDVEEEKSKDKDTQFRELFIQHEVRVPTPQVQKKEETSSSVSESLESMPVKELRRLAEQRGMTGVSELRKKELLAALRNQVSVSVSAPVLTSDPPAPAEGNDVTVERTLDLTDDAIILE